MAAGPRPGYDAAMDIAMLLYENMTSLDFVGPFEVFGVMPGARILTVAKQAGPIHVDAGMPLLNARHGLREVPRADVLFVPGSSNNTHVLQDEEILAWLRDVDRGTRWTTSVCTGSLVLAAAGLLKGVRATTHWAALESLAGLGAVPVRERVVCDGKYVTGAGVSAGIDMALVLAAREFDDLTAQAIQLAIEYDPHPPFHTGSPATAPPAVTERALAMLVAGAERVRP
jgi:transcriptional regulator GlxA family with amidase domain